MMVAETFNRESPKRYENANAEDMRGANASQRKAGREGFSAERKYAAERIANSVTGVFDGDAMNRSGYHTANTIAAESNESKPATLFGEYVNIIAA
jgi:hypothetical protein